MADLEQKNFFESNSLQKLAHVKTIQSHPGVFQVTYVEGTGYLCIEFYFILNQFLFNDIIMIQISFINFVLLIFVLLLS